MQTQQEQEQANIVRLEAYRKKLSPKLRSRARLAQQIATLGRKSGLSLPKVSAAIRPALSLFESGCRPVTAYEIGSKIIKQIAANSHPEHASPH